MKTIVLYRIILIGLHHVERLIRHAVYWTLFFCCRHVSLISSRVSLVEHGTLSNAHKHVVMSFFLVRTGHLF